MNNFLENKYSLVYWKLMTSAADRQRSSPLTGYIEKHHAVPSSLGGLDNGSNIVQLTAREHFIAHHLLTKFTVGEDRRKMCYALSYFSTGNQNHGRKLTARQYQIARSALSQARSNLPAAARVKLNLAVSRAKRGAVHTAEHRESAGAALTVKHSYVACSPDNEIFIGGDLEQFCKIKELSFNTVDGKALPFVITAGKRKGWVFCVELDTLVSMIEIRTAALLKARENRVAGVKAGWVARQCTDMKIVKQNDTKILSFICRGQTVQFNAHDLPNELIQIGNAEFFKDELINKSQIVQRIINSDQKITESKIDLGEVLFISTVQANQFLNKHHLEGAGEYSVMPLALNCGDSILAVMNFSSCGINSWEIVRFCAPHNISRECANKFIQTAKHHLAGDIRVAINLRYQDPQIYTDLGFKFMHNTEPEIWYTRADKRCSAHRFNIKLPRLRAKFNPELSDAENITALGWSTIKDQGYSVYRLSAV